MQKYGMRLFVALIAGLPAAAALPVVEAPVQAATVDARAAATFIQKLSAQAFEVLRNPSMSRQEVRAEFRKLLRDSFAVQQIGDRLIRRYRTQITPQQYQAYQAAFPDFVIDTYADRLYEYSNSDLKVVRAVPRGHRGDADVYTRITLPDAGSVIDAIWAVRQQPTGQFQVTNLTVSGVNLSLTQEADFSSYIDRNGFDALIAFMKSAGEKA